MYKTTLTLLCLAWLFVSACTQQAEINRTQDFNFNWKFTLDEKADASASHFDDANWRELNLPHDWSVEFPFDTINGEGNTAYLPGGTAWYRKHFDVETNKNVTVLFDGVYNNSEYWINGEKLGFHPYGYTPVHFNLTPYLNKDGKNNIIAVKVDHTRFADSRWYTGSGIYRNVKLITSDKLHVPVWGTFITTPQVSKESAKVVIQTKVKNTKETGKDFTLVTRILNPSGQEVQKAESKLQLEAGKENETSQEITVSAPELWSVDNPNLYKAVSQVVINNKVVDEYETTFGIRTIKFDAKTGFFLNGVNMKIKGVCLHHDAGLVGAAVPKEVWRKRFQTLKEGGCNAIRVSHNPASDEFLELCDEMGLLVQDEFFDEWDYPKDKRLNMWEQHNDYISRGYGEHFQEWAERDLKTTVMAHRNHPSVFQWSIGNEIEWTYPRNKQATGFWDADWGGNYFWSPTPLTPDEIKKRYNELPAKEHTIGETAQKLSKWTKELDTTRPVIANCILPSASYISGYADALDIIGFSYRRVMYDYGQTYFPNKPLMGTENLPQWHEWKAIMERDHVSGTFLWTGMDYMGEAHHRGAGERRKGTHSGLIDYAGFPRPSYFMYKSLWSDDATLHISTQTLDKSLYKIEGGKLVERQKDAWKQALWFWHDVNTHWNYAENENIVVEIISNLPELELFLNGKSLGTKKLADFEDRMYKWLVPYSKGELIAKGTFNGKEVSEEIKTAGKASSVSLTADKTTLAADGYDVAEVVIQLSDDNGNPVEIENQKINFKIIGDVKFLGVDNGNTYSFQSYQANKINTYKGRAKLMIQAKQKACDATITVSGKTIKSNTIALIVK